MNEFLELARTDFVPPTDLTNRLESERSFDLEDPCYYQITNSKIHGMYDGVFMKAVRNLN